MYFDAHTHLNPNDYAAILSQSDVYFAASAGNTGQCQFLSSIEGQFKNLLCCYGVHPWYADAITFEEMLPYLSQGRYIGEIGMDSVWCKTDLSVQQKVFYKQLAYAQDFSKPVILHTKGCEAQIAEIIQDFSMPILVHWYAEIKHIERYIAKDCYFTIGPDIAINDAVLLVAKSVQPERLMIETDGLSALQWALGRNASPRDIPIVLKNTIAIIARIKKMEVEALTSILLRNALTFYSKNLLTSTGNQCNIEFKQQN